MTQPNISPSPPREEENPDVQAPVTFDIALVRGVLQNFANGFLASLAQSIPSNTHRATVEVSGHDHVYPPVGVQTECNRGVPQAPRVPHVVTNVNVEHHSTRNRSFLDYRREFNRSKPRVFSGATGPSDAIAWLDLVEKRLDELHVPDQCRTNIAVGRLVGKSLDWWKSIRTHYEDDAHPWSNFCALFLNRFVMCDNSIEHFHRGDQNHNITNKRKQTGKVQTSKSKKKSRFTGNQ